MDTDSFTVHVKREDIYTDIVKVIEYLIHKIWDRQTITKRKKQKGNCK